MKNAFLASLLAVCAAIVIFGAGFMVGREFPKHHYQLGTSGYLFDTTTGRGCSMFQKDTIETGDDKLTNPIDPASKGALIIPKCGQ